MQKLVRPQNLARPEVQQPLVVEQEKRPAKEEALNCSRQRLHHWQQRVARPHQARNATSRSESARWRGACVAADGAAVARPEPTGCRACCGTAVSGRRGMGCGYSCWRANSSSCDCVQVHEATCTAMKSLRAHHSNEHTWNKQSTDQEQYFADSSIFARSVPQLDWLVRCWPLQLQRPVSRRSRLCCFMLLRTPIHIHAPVVRPSLRRPPSPSSGGSATSERRDWIDSDELLSAARIASDLTRLWVSVADGRRIAHRFPSTSNAASFHRSRSFPIAFISLLLIALALSRDVGQASVLMQNNSGGIAGGNASRWNPAPTRRCVSVLSRHHRWPRQSTSSSCSSSRRSGQRHTSSDSHVRWAAYSLSLSLSLSLSGPKNSSSC